MAAAAPAPAPPPARLTIYCIGTLDTKGQELLYVAQQVSSNMTLFCPAAHGQVEVVTVDVSSSQAAVVEPESGHSHVSRQHVLSCHPDASLRSSTSLPSDRGAAVSVLSAALREFLRTEGGVAGAIGIGGSGGTALIAPALRELPIGVPKILVSTVASGNAEAFVQGSDLVLWPSVVDLSGLNSFSSRILNNAASALAGMVAGIISNKLYGNQSESGSGAGRPTVGLTMFGVTTPCVNAVQTKLREAGFESLVFHATGTGGQVMENMVTQGLLQGVIDVTTTEVADYVVGGVMPCKSNRFEAMIQMGVPLVVSVGALDMVNFWERNGIPAEFSTRQFHVHNEKVTVMRTTVEENKKFANFIADALNKSSAPVRVLLPDHGVSALDASDMPFYDPEAREALYNQLQQAVHQTADRQIQRKPLHINDQDFAEALVQAFLAIASESSDIEVPSIEGPLNVKNEQETASMSSGIDAAQTVHKLPDQGATTDGCTVQQHSLSFDVTKAEDSSRHVKCGDTSLPRSLVLQRLRGQISRGIPIIGAGAGTGISAKFEEEGGADLIILYNSGRFRMAGRGSLAGLMPYKDANAVLVDMASEVLPVVKKVPVLAGVCASDPFRQIRSFLRQLADMGFAGVQNFPTVGLIDGNFRQNLEETGMGYGLEVDMIRQAHDLGLLTTPYAFNETESRQMASAGADIIVAHMGLTTAGSIGAKTAISLEESARRVKAIAVAAQEIKPDILVLCHGGPISGPEEAAFVIQKSGVHGFYGASSMERLPVETAIVSTMRKFKQVKLR